MPFLIIRRRPIERPWNEITTMVFRNQLRFICKLNLVLACIVVIAGILAISVPIAGLYMKGLIFYGNCFWTGGILIIFSIWGLVVCKEGQFSQDRIKLQTAIALFALIAAIAGQVVLGFALSMIVADFSDFAGPTTMENVDYDGAKTASLVTAILVAVIDSVFYYSTGRWIRLTVGLPKYISERAGRTSNIPIRRFRNEPTVRSPPISSMPSTRITIPPRPTQPVDESLSVEQRIFNAILSDKLQV